MTKHRGFSLLDLIVSIFLGSILTYIIALFLSGVVRQYFSINEKLNLSHQARSFRDAVTRGLRNTTSSALTISADGQRFGFQTFGGIEPPENLRWSEHYVVVAFDKAKQVVHHWSPAASTLGLSDARTAHPQLLSLQTLESVSPSSNSSQHLLWQHATSFEAAFEGAQALRVMLTFEHTGVRQNRHKLDFVEVYPLTNDREL